MHNSYCYYYARTSSLVVRFEPSLLVSVSKKEMLERDEWQYDSPIMIVYHRENCVPVCVSFT